MRSGATDTFASVSPSEAVAASLSIRFVGKPHRAMAVHYVRPAEYPDNRRVFVVRASIWLSVTHELHRAIDAGRQAAYDNRSPNGKLEHLALKDFDAYPDGVIVYGVVERLPECHGIFGFVVPMDSSWSDFSSRDIAWQTMPKDPLGNSIAYSQGHLVARVRLKDVIVVKTADPIPFAEKEPARQTKPVTYSRRASFGNGSASHGPLPVGLPRFAGRGGTLRTKRIYVKPCESLSLQEHRHRAEHSIVDRGAAQVTCEHAIFLLSAHRSTYIPLGTGHRLSNPRKTLLEIIEVQSGAYMGADDIIRFEENYERMPP
jgi:mannose-1-phosphate guanylyltransferase/mannose-6-phosphate isomerase